MDKAWDKVSEVAYNALDAYMNYCEEEHLPHSYLLGLDILITGIADETGKKVIDIRPTMLEGPCCNSYPACPNFFSSRLYQKLKAEIGEDLVDYPVHPTMIMDKIVEAYLGLWKARGHSNKPVVGIFTRPYPESEEETAHIIACETFKKYGVNVFRITPDENPCVKHGKLYVNGTAVDLCHRRIERIHVPLFYGEKLGNQIINETPDTIWINPWKIDDLRSKTIEEDAFRRWEKKTGKVISRPITLLGKEITPESVKKLFETGGYALKRWNSTGGKGIFLHVYLPKVKDIYDKLYVKYDGRHMILVDEKNEEKYLSEFENFKEDAAIQQMRIIDARDLGDDKRLVYDTRINALYNEDEKKWHLISGISRSVPCGPKVANGNSLLTNVSSGAEISILIMGRSKKGTKSRMNFGPLLSTMIAGRKEMKI
ncbi:MAG: hypothetical protein BWY64_02629 [bacterium ADurb.Bin363]|nr:MAG: hypothetical protein BWY64_02629 [bacterium ADurb.Bin363]